MFRWTTWYLAVLIFASAGWSMDLLSTTAISGRAQDVVISGDYAYSADQYGLWLLDVSDPQIPATLSHWGSQGLSESLVKHQNFIYLCDGENGLAVIDASDPASPEYLGQASGISSAIGAEVSGSHLFVATGLDGLAVLDLSAPAAPAKIGEYVIPAWSSSLAVGPNFVALGSTDSLRLLDVSDPTNPLALSTISVIGDVRHLLIDANSNLLIVLRIEQGVSLYDVANAAQPALRSTFETGGWSTSMALWGDTLIVADWFDGLSFHDISVPERPQPIAAFTPNGFPSGLSLQDNLLALAVGDQGIEVWDISNLSNPIYQGAEDPLGSPQDAVWDAEGLIFEAAGDAGLRVWDENLTSAQPLAQVETDGWANALALSPNWIYLSDGFEGVRIFDRSGSPGDSFTISLAEYAGPMSINSSNDLFVAQGDAGFASMRLEGLSAPQVFGATATAGFTYDLAAAGNLLVTCEGSDGLEIFDVSDPANPQLFSTVAPEGGAWCAALAPERAFIGVGSQGLSVYDISEPGSPALLSTTGDLGWVQALILDDSGQTIIASSGMDGIYALAADQIPPVVMDQFDTYGFARRCAFNPSGVICADDMDLSLFGGLVGVTGEAAAPISYEIMRAYPNPFNPATRITFSLATAGKVNLSIYDLMGRQVDQLLSGRLTSGSHEMSWQPHARVSSGTYFIQLNTGQQTQVQRILYLK